MLLKYEPATIANLEILHGSIVRCGSAGALWKVQSLKSWATVANVVLEPQNAHVLPLDQKIIDLPLPNSRWGN